MSTPYPCFHCGASEDRLRVYGKVRCLGCGLAMLSSDHRGTDESAIRNWNSLQEKLLALKKLEREK